MKIKLDQSDLIFIWLVLLFMSYNAAVRSDIFDLRLPLTERKTIIYNSVLLELPKGRGKLKDDDAEKFKSALLEIGRIKCKKSFEILFNYYVPRLVSFMRATRISEKIADELAQEVMIKVWRKAEMFDPLRGNVSAWIFTIARNIRTDAIRAKLRPTFDPTDPIFDTVELSGDQKIINAEQAKTIIEEIENLPPEQSELIRLSFYEGLAHPEIAQRIGIPLGTVKSRIRLAFVKLRSALEIRENENAN